MPVFFRGGIAREFTYAIGPELPLVRTFETFPTSAEWSAGVSYREVAENPFSFNLVPAPAAGEASYEFGWVHQLPEASALFVQDNKLQLTPGGAEAVTPALTNKFTFSVLVDGERYSAVDESSTPGIYYRNYVFNYPTTAVAGTLAHHLQTTVRSLLIGVTNSAANRAQWSSNNYNPTSLVATRNPNNPVSNLVDTTWITAAVQGRDQSFPGMLISPRHVLFSHHVFPGTAKAVAFVSSSGQVFTANIKRRTPGTMAGIADSAIGYLDADIPANISPVKFFPSTVFKYTSVFNHRREVGALRVGDITPTIALISRQAQGGFGARFGVQQLRSAIKSSGSADDYIDNQYWYIHSSLGEWNQGGLPLNPPYGMGGFGVTGSGGWYSPVIGGDSGSPSFLVVNGQPVLVMSQWDIGGGSNYVGNGAILNANMNAIKDAGDTTVYAVQEVDLSGFPVLYPDA